MLSRPAVEAGEHLGFLPGDLSEKVNPYLRPLYDALTDMMELARWQRLLERGTIEIAPLAFMRGRTLNDAFIIVDEAQNTTREQMKMLLTRLGLRFQSHRHRRHNADGPSSGAGERLDRDSKIFKRHSRYLIYLSDRKRCGAQSFGAKNSAGIRKI